MSQELLRESLNRRRLPKGRHRSVNSQKSCEFPSHKAVRATSKLHSNVSLLYVLTHKRSASECPRNTHFKHPTTPQTFAALRSLNLSRKTSVRELPAKADKNPATAGSQGDLKRNFVLLCGGERGK